MSASRQDGEASVDTDARSGRERDTALLRRVLARIQKVPRISWRALAVSLGPVLALAALAALLTIQFVRPAPPRTLTISSGPAGSILWTTAEKYRAILARNGITLKVLTSAGSLENLERLTDPHSGVDIAFVQGGVTASGDSSDIVSLGSLFYEPLVVFYHSAQPLQRLSQLRGQRIGVGVKGSGTRFLALALLKANGIVPGAGTRLEGIEGNTAMKALLDGRVDAIFLSGESATLENFRELLHASGVRIFDFAQADAYIRRFRYLTSLAIPAGTFDLGDNLPAHSINMLAPTVELLAHSDLHPALVDLLIASARRVNGRGNVLQKPGEFPAPLRHGWPISEEALRFYKSGKSFAYRYMPFWLASLMTRTFVVLIPLLIVLIPLLPYVPTFYGWVVKNRIYRRYGDLMALERAALDPLTPEQRNLLIARLDDIEKDVITLKMPGAYADQAYVLRQHVGFVREQLAKT